MADAHHHGQNGLGPSILLGNASLLGILELAKAGIKKNVFSEILKKRKQRQGKSDPHPKVCFVILLLKLVL